MGTYISLFGVPVWVSVWSLFIIVIFTLDGMLYIRKHYKTANKVSLWSAAFIASLIVIVSVVIHEMAHGVVSTLFGAPILGAGITGWGGWVEPSKMLSDLTGAQEFLIAIAGPLVNLALGGAFAYFVWIWPETLAENTVQYLAYTNIRLGKFNLYPLFILDGAKVVEGLSRMMPNETLQILAYAFYTAILVWLILFFKPTRTVEHKLATL